MEDTSFIDLLKDEKFKKISIDVRLKEPFKRVIKKMQVFFNANGYTKERDYASFFKEYLLTDGDKKISFEVTNEPSSLASDGFYTLDGKRIVIDERIIGFPDSVEHALCHEFIHFLVHRAIDTQEEFDDNIKHGGFIDEAMTESLTKLIYPGKGSYEPQVNLMGFSNLLIDSANNYSKFLRGGIDFIRFSNSTLWTDFFNFIKRYQEEYAKVGYEMRTAINNENYIKAQRQLINNQISPYTISNINDYEQIIKKLNKRPVCDGDFINDMISKMQVNFVSKFQYLECFKSVIIKLLEKYTNNLLTIENLQNFYEFEIFDVKITIDKNGQVNFKNNILEDGYSKVTYYQIGKTIRFIGNYNGNIVEKIICLDDINFHEIEEKNEKKKKELLFENETLLKCFNQSNKEEISIILSIINRPKLVRIRKYNLSLDGKLSKSIYVAEYTDRLEIIGNSTSLGIKKFKEIGKTYIYSTLPLTAIENKARTFFNKILLKNMSDEEKTEILDFYKKSNKYDEFESLSYEELLLEAIVYYSREKQLYSKLSDDDKDKLRKQVINSNLQFLVTINNEQLIVASFIGDNVYKNADVDFLYNRRGQGKYNDLIGELRKFSLPNNSINCLEIPFDDNGELDFSQDLSNSRNKNK